jgi:hypothetical protein
LHHKQAALTCSASSCIKHQSSLHTIRVCDVPSSVNSVDLIAVASSNQRNTASIAEWREGVSPELVTVTGLSRATQPAIVNNIIVNRGHIQIHSKTDTTSSHTWAMTDEMSVLIGTR